MSITYICSLAHNQLIQKHAMVVRKRGQIGFLLKSFEKLYFVYLAFFKKTGCFR